MSLLDKLHEFKLKFKLKNNINLQLFGHGIDTYAKCKDKKHFASFPYEVDYKYNSLGYRDEELPTDLKNAIWCIGDSFTVGLGSPIEHTWFRVLQKETKVRCINISMDGASNKWISMLATFINKNFNPKNMVCCWSYPERRQLDEIEFGNTYLKNSYNRIKDITWPVCNDIRDFNKLPLDIRKEVLNHEIQLDLEVNNNLEIIKIYVSYDELRVKHIQHPGSVPEDDLTHTIECIQQVEECKKGNLVHSFIPDFCHKEQKQIYLDKIGEVVKNPIYIEYLDRSRDGHHFDILTSKELVKNIIKQLDLDKQ